MTRLGRKSKTREGGGKKSKAAQLYVYTPVMVMTTVIMMTAITAMTMVTTIMTVMVMTG